VPVFCGVYILYKERTSRGVFVLCTRIKELSLV